MLKKQVQGYVKEDLKKRIEAKAMLEQRSVNNFVGILIELGLQEYEKQQRS